MQPEFQFRPIAISIFDFLGSLGLFVLVAGCLCSTSPT
jgi:hypothetical protein